MNFSSILHFHRTNNSKCKMKLTKTSIQAKSKPSTIPYTSRKVFVIFPHSSPSYLKKNISMVESELAYVQNKIRENPLNYTD